MNPMVRRPSALRTWEKALDLVEQTYKLTRKLPQSEPYELRGELQRAAASIQANIAEGHCVTDRRKYMDHLSTALSALKELESQLFLMQLLKYAKEPDMTGCVSAALDLERTLISLRISLEKNAATS